MKSRTYRDKNDILRYEYLRVCSCGDEKWVHYKPKEDTLCGVCSSKQLGFAMSQNNRKEEKDKIVYTRVCEDCDDVRTDLKAKPNEPQLCTDCSKKRTGVGASNEDFAASRITITKANGKAKTMWLRTCANKECGESAYITFKPVDGQVCQNCARRVSHSMKDKIVKRPKGNKPRTKPNKPRKRTVKKVSNEAIEKAKEINREHREAITEVKIIPQKLTDNEMVAKFLETNIIKVTSVPENWGNYVSPMVASVLS